MIEFLENILAWLMIMAFAGLAGLGCMALLLAVVHFVSFIVGGGY